MNENNGDAWGDESARSAPRAGDEWEGAPVVWVYMRNMGIISEMDMEWRVVLRGGLYSELGCIEKACWRVCLKVCYETKYGRRCIMKACIEGIRVWVKEESI